MDTKLKKSKSCSVLYGTIWILELLVLSFTALGASIFAALQEMEWLNGYEHEYYSGYIINEAGYYRLQNITGIGCIIGVIVAVALFILLAIMAGRFSKDEDGKIRINWFDKIWSEIQLIVGVGAAVLLSVPLKGFFFSWMRGLYLNIWSLFEPKQYSSGITDEVEITFYGVLLVACFVVILLCLISIIKKIKARQFWEKSLLGGAFLAIYRSIKGSEKTLLKVLVILMSGAFLSATWIGLPITLVLILIFVPKMVKKFNSIKKGVEEVKNGNLEYKIPIDEDIKGIRGELDKLAAGINDISQASNVAVQNELKNQRMKTDLISNVSHDLKTPLTSMVSYVDLMKQEGLDSPNAPEYLDIIDNKTQRLKALTEDLFEAAKASSGAIPVNMESIDLASLLTQSLAEMEGRLAAKNLTVQIKNDCEDAHVMADGQLMWRVLENLLGNISKYALEGSRVYVNMSDVAGKGEGAKDMIVLEVKNISKDPLNISADELMERFKRGDESRNTEGSGLGLAIAKDLVKLMKGVFEITIDGDLFKATVMLEK